MKTWWRRFKVRTALAAAAAVLATEVARSVGLDVTVTAADVVELVGWVIGGHVATDVASLVMGRQAPKEDA